jgi:hypothetical protein
MESTLKKLPRNCGFFYILRANKYTIMKKLICVLLATLSITARAQSGPLLFDETVKLPAKKDRSEMFDAAAAWYDDMSAVKKSITFKNRSAGEISGKFWSPFGSTKKMMKSLKTVGPITFKFHVFITDSSYRYSLYEFTHDGNDHYPGGGISFGVITGDDFCPYKAIKGGKGWKNDVWGEIRDRINSLTHTIIADLKSKMEAGPSGTR